eukprot:m51a1_g5418 hypothetical protein (796) ;mRNA; f:127172-130202
MRQVLSVVASLALLAPLCGAAAVSLTTPTNGATLTTACVHFSWTYADNLNYTLLLGTDRGSLTARQWTLDTSMTYQVPAAGTYFWQVQYSSQAASGATGVFSFTTCTASCLPEQELGPGAILDAGFDAVPVVGWTVDATKVKMCSDPGPIQDYQRAYNVTPHSGSRYVFMGGTPGINCDQKITQKITVRQQDKFVFIWAVIMIVDKQSFFNVSIDNDIVFSSLVSGSDKIDKGAPLSLRAFPISSSVADGQSHNLVIHTMSYNNASKTTLTNIFLDDVSIGDCTSLDKASCVTIGSTCQWCDYAGMCVDAKAQCPGCSTFNTRAKCCLADLNSGCGFCGSSPSDKCYAAGSYTCLTNCSSHGYDDCPAYDCVACPTTRKCLFNTKQAVCPKCSGLRDAASCSAAVNCSWCGSSLSCLEPTEQCQPCGSYGSQDRCTPSGCHWCYTGASCRLRSQECYNCTPVAPQSSCDANKDCSWCDTNGTCTAADSHAAQCPQCAAMLSEGACAPMPGCQWCAALGVCNAKASPCRNCSSFASAQDCGGWKACSWCQSQRTCLVAEAAAAGGCPWCGSFGAYAGCVANAGCKFCNATQTCNSTTDTCATCVGISSSICLSRPGCCYNGNECLSSGSPLCSPTSPSKDNNDSSMPFWGWIIIGVGGGAIAIGLIAVAVAIGMRRRKHKPNFPVEMRTDSAFIVMPQDRSAGVGSYQTGAPTGHGSAGEVVLSGSGGGITSGYTNSAIVEPQEQDSTSSLPMNLAPVLPVGVMMTGQMAPVVVQASDSVYQQQSEAQPQMVQMIM